MDGRGIAIDFEGELAVPMQFSSLTGLQFHLIDLAFGIGEERVALVDHEGARHQFALLGSKIFDIEATTLTTDCRGGSTFLAADGDRYTIVAIGHIDTEKEGSRRAAIPRGAQVIAEARVIGISCHLGERNRQTSKFLCLERKAAEEKNEKRKNMFHMC